ncbi:MAG: hypothetical protein M0C28_46440 [Candidatus Moduliflexus flocculans]|nr:hypothetical protein [Candidatus Moduliflexus flocculans]
MLRRLSVSAILVLTFLAAGAAAQNTGALGRAAPARRELGRGVRLSRPRPGAAVRPHPPRRSLTERQTAPPSTSPRPRAACGRRRTTARRSSRSCPTASSGRHRPRRARALRTPTSSGWARAIAASGRIPCAASACWKSVGRGQDLGLAWASTETRHIGRIAIHPREPRHRLRGGRGLPLQLELPDRGLYKTDRRRQDLGQGPRPRRDDRVGVVDVVIDPNEPVHGLRGHLRQVSASRGTSTRAARTRPSTSRPTMGRSWRKLGGGLPAGKLGRIGLAIYPEEPATSCTPSIDNAQRAPAHGRGGQAGRGRRRGGAAAAPAPRSAARSTAPRTAARPGRRRTPTRSRSAAASGTARSTSIPTTTRWSTCPARPSSGRSTAAGPGAPRPRRTWPAPFHVDYHAIWMDPARLPAHHPRPATAAWPSPTISAKTWDAFDHLPLAQFYAVGVDMDEPYNIYGGLQDNGSVKIPSNGPSRRDHARRLDLGRRRRRHGQRRRSGRQPLAVQRLAERRHPARRPEARHWPRSIRPRPAGGPAGLPVQLDRADRPLAPQRPRIVYLGAQVLLRSLEPRRQLAGDHRPT